MSPSGQNCVSPLSRCYTGFELSLDLGVYSEGLRYGSSKIMGARGGSENETQFRGYTVISLLKERLDNEHHRVFLTREVKIHVRDESRTSAVGGYMVES